MREIDVKLIDDAVREMAIAVNYELGPDVKSAIDNAASSENHPGAESILKMIQENIKIAGKERIPLCQDTGTACVFLEIGQDVHFTGGGLYEAVNSGVRRGYSDGYLRKSIVSDPLRRENTGDNTPARIVSEIVPGDRVKITFAAKGMGAENMSRIEMMPPSKGREGVIDFVVDTVRRAGGNPCPPIVCGVGIGSNFDGVALLAKKALLLPLDEANEDPYYAAMEKEILERINELDIGPQGFGGKTTALGVRILAAPCHIAGMPVAVNINCHVARHEERTL